MFVIGVGPFGLLLEPDGIVFLIVFGSGRIEVGQGGFPAQEAVYADFLESILAILVLNFEFCERRALESLYFELEGLPLKR